MKLTVLVENTSTINGYEKEKGLSFYITTDRHKILFDCGMGSKFADNSRKMGIDLSGVDLAFISHGHQDHGGGLEEFLRINKIAPIYIQKTTFGKYYAKKRDRFYYGGLNQKLSANPRFTVLDGAVRIDEELQIISKVHRKKEIWNLYMKSGVQYLPDVFEHEQSLVISEKDKKVLVSGCSHCGIENILSSAQEICGKINFVIGGFHLIAYDFKKDEDLLEIDSLAKNLLAENSVYYTCHCTSTSGYSRLKKTMGERIGYLSTGNTIFI
ncbi:MAG: MBL fold metallo-hydrolase [Anaerolineae bacterium]|nr:MBL fold metallo-hydrolase [Anaerolineae bacterium]